MANILLIGSGAREHALAVAINRSKRQNNLFCFAEYVNPRIKAMVQGYELGNLAAVEAILAYAQQQRCDLVIVGPEKPLAFGVADILLDNKISVIGPQKRSAQIETDKSFARILLDHYGIAVNPAYKIFSAVDDMQAITAWLLELNGNYVIKANGLAAGKGVKVAGKHLFNLDDALVCCREFLAQHSSIVIEEKLIGQEFSLHSFVSGEHVVHMPIVQDHKAAYVGDLGPNTGGMGSFTDANHSLPFLSELDVITAWQVNEKVILALKQATQQDYKGILYGSYIATQAGIKVIEFNARFGDPEALNLLSLLETDFVDICMAIGANDLQPSMVRFKRLASVCKYIVPDGYPNAAITNAPICIGKLNHPENLFFGAVSEEQGVLATMSSRSMAYVALASTINEAFTISETELSQINGRIFYRNDIGSSANITYKINFMRELRGEMELVQNA